MIDRTICEAMNDMPIDACVTGNLTTQGEPNCSPTLHAPAGTDQAEAADSQSILLAPEPAVTAARDSAPESGPTARQRRFRERHRRVDYTPDDDVLGILDDASAQNPGMSLSRVLDALVSAGATHYSECTRADLRPAGAVESSQSVEARQ